jgi:signal transduction histidine kinase/DNA-binding NarL/FixJ family response regulator
VGDLIVFVNGPLPGVALDATYNPWLVALSYLVASAAAFTAMDFGARMRAARAEGRATIGWQVGGAFAMGAGIWCMHFVAMLAYGLPVAVRYDLATTLLSLLFAIVISGFALAIVSRQSLSPLRLVSAGAIMGAGIGTMHYSGMIAMRLDALVLYEPGWFLVSVLNAIVCSTVALWLIFFLGTRRDQARYQLLSALVMGVAICGMHYTGMYATVCVSTGAVASGDAAVDPTLLALMITGVTLLVLGAAIGTSTWSIRRSLEQQNLLLQEEVAMRERIERELQQAKDSAEGASRAKSAFLATVSHEIRTPMNAVLGTLELLGLSGLNAEQHESLDIALDSSKSLLRLIDDILDFSKIEAGKLELRAEPASITDLVTRVVQVYAGVASAKGLLLTVRVDPAVATAVRVDRLRLRQILGNFVGNAVKFTPQGRIELDVRALDSESQQQTVAFSVCDTGVGIDPQQMDKLFQPFVQGDSASTRRYAGTGLGLAICRRLAHLMGGRIEIDSSPDRGTTITLTLPLPVIAPSELDDVNTAISVPGAPLVARTAPAVAEAEEQGRLVLVVDDHATNRRVLGRQLALLGYASVAAGDGRAGLEILGTRRIGLVLTDCQMPEMDGYQLAREIRARERREAQAVRTVIVAVTANTLPESVATCLEAGMDEFIAKPVELAALRRLLESRLPLEAPQPMAADGGAVGSPSAETVAPPTLDRAMLAALSGGSAAIELEICTEFRHTNDLDLRNLSEAAASGDLASIARCAHRIKGAARALGATDVATAAASIDAAAQRRSLPDAMVALNQLGAAVRRLYRLLEHEVFSPSSFGALR